MTEVKFEDKKKEKLFNLMVDMPIETIQIAFLYAKNYTEYGIDVTKTWNTAIQNASALEQAYKSGYYEAMDKFALEEASKRIKEVTK